MKKIALLSLCGLIAAPAVFASQATDKKFNYCDDITVVDKLQDRSTDSVERIKADGVKIERIVVSKDRKELYLISGETLVRAYSVAFGREPEGHKQFEGDKKTPEGLYFIDSKNPNSAFTKALHVSYPNQADIAYAKSQGKSPGGDIMIHGLPTESRNKMAVGLIHPFNWTQGCVAVKDEEIEEIYSLVKEKTLVEICKTSK